MTCATARQRTLKTPTTSGVRAIEGLTAWQVAPNPVREGGLARLLVQTEQAFDADIQVFTTTGQQVYNQAAVQLGVGSNAVDLPVGQLDNGFYFVVLQSGEGRAVRKFSVLK